MQTQNLDLRRSRDIGAMVTLTFDFLRINFRSLFRAVLLIAGPPIALLAVLSGVMFADMLDLSQMGDIQPGDFGPVMDLMSKFGLTILFSVLVGWILTAVVNAYVVLYDERKGEGEIDVAEVRSRFFASLPMVIFTGIVTSIVTVVGFVFLVIPGIYLALALSLTYMIRMVEGKGLFEAMKRSTSLISGHWWSTLGLVIVISIINGFIGMVFSVPQYIVTALYAIGAAEGDSPSSSLHLAMVITTIIQTFCTHLLNAVLVTAVTLQYYNLVEKKEGLGSMARIDEIGAQPDVPTYR